VAWFTNNANIASVAQGGLVTASGVGSTTITAQSASGGQRATCMVTVRGREQVALNSWLTGYRGEPAGSSGRVVTYDFNERAKLREVNPIDWYSYEGQSGANMFVRPYLGNKEVYIGTHGELKDENGRYWITLGPKVFIENYPNNGALKADEFKDYIGSRVDVILRNSNTNEFIFIECVWIGHLKAHTYSNGIYQTGHPYPNSDIASSQPYNVGYVNGCIIEFTGQKLSDNGTMSNYVVDRIIVYPK